MFNRPEGKIDLTDPEKSTLRLDAVAFANQTRERLGISLYDPIDIINLVERDGIYVFQIKDLGCSGFVRVFDDQRVIFVNASESLGRQHYTIAHEYCHILRDLKNYTRLKELPEDEFQYEMKRMEYFAFKFADYFIMPEASLFHALTQFDVRDYGKITLQDILRIQHHFGVSYLQTIRMLNKAHVLTDLQQTEFRAYSTKEDPERLIKVTLEAGFSEALIIPLKHSRIPGEYLESLADNIHNRRLTPRKVKHLESLLGIPLMNLMPEPGQGGTDD
ncbi:ImmA/IrrE family metallo-endopeptidase [Paenibacillus sp. N4]|uniref:ImmA/IrrE family metallo-endopeptidase n=1 Tax=Paenibacillus vietnamensis TaxID=2590547 RepID=UPI001CD14CE2|nr:ImmA/IrrE family metallo-endopeptidase [Paenibacillus vietnamensis]MCA0757039.1 ImmA/IrrE family metallo-endopeptidase [Paenibacillus vietnamensis]